MRSRELVVVGVACSCGVAIAGPVTYVEQTRSVGVSVWFPSPPDPVSIVSTGAGVFDETVSIVADNDTGDFGSAIATQRSTLGARAITMRGKIDAFGSTDATGGAVSSLESTFVLGGASDYSFRSSLADLFQGELTFQFIATLVDASDAEVFSVNSNSLTLPDTGDYVFDTVGGTLAAGAYTLTIDVLSSGFKGTSSGGAYDVRLDVPSPGGVAGVLAAGAVLAGRRRRVGG